MSIRPVHLAPLLVAVLLPLARAEEPDPSIDPMQTAIALRAVLAAANQTIPQTSTCFGFYFDPKKATVRDLLAMQLAFLHTGRNTVIGGCNGSQCTLRINHENEEDVASAALTFKVVNGVAQASSMHCEISP